MKCRESATITGNGTALSADSGTKKTAQAAIQVTSRDSATSRTHSVQALKGRNRSNTQINIRAISPLQG